MRITDDVRYAFDDPAVRHGAELEARHRNAAAGSHRELVDYVRNLATAATCLESTTPSAELAVTAAEVFTADRPLRDRVAAAVRILGVPLPFRLRLRLTLLDL